MSKTIESLEDYNILELIGQGSYAKVYKAEDKITKETVAIKQI